MTKENQKRLYNHFLAIGRTEDAEAIDKVYNFSGKKKEDKNILDKISENKNNKKN